MRVSISREHEGAYFAGFCAAGVHASMAPSRFDAMKTFCEQ